MLHYNVILYLYFIYVTNWTNMIANISKILKENLPVYVQRQTSYHDIESYFNQLLNVNLLFCFMYLHVYQLILEYPSKL